VTAPDVQGIYAWFSGDDSSRLWRIASRYQLSQEEVELLYGIKSKNKTAVIVEIWTERDFELYMDNALLEGKPNPYGFIPFVIFPNLREPKKFWGISDLPQIMESQRELNRAMSQLSRILELSGNPIAVLENVEESEDIAVKPGAVWNIPEDAKAYLLDLLQGGGVNLHINYIDLIYRSMHDLSESPRSAFGGIEKSMSGVALLVTVPCKLYGCYLGFYLLAALKAFMGKDKSEIIIADILDNIPAASPATRCHFTFTSFLAADNHRTHIHYFRRGDNIRCRIQGKAYPGKGVNHCRLTE
jgi:hypothetical protein